MSAAASRESLPADDTGGLATCRDHESVHASQLLAETHAKEM